ncbi:MULTISPECIES: hypothetical protein [unclassified Vibrio]|uniref:Uncharacterized protein n=1 Tax=Vibrio sp. HB236076 TaxID=3232307 RepID=A0AB39HLA3_9VIBR|nr:hypothetical protein [Vibrio sp. HB161653]MDP5252575.1 hypothetical protein [Vibrio sp. HB161653]
MAIQRRHSGNQRSLNFDNDFTSEQRQRFTKVANSAAKQKGDDDYSPQARITPPETITPAESNSGGREPQFKSTLAKQHHQQAKRNKRKKKRMQKLLAVALLIFLIACLYGMYHLD